MIIESVPYNRIFQSFVVEYGAAEKAPVTVKPDHMNNPFAKHGYGLPRKSSERKS